MEMFDVSSNKTESGRNGITKSGAHSLVRVPLNEPAGTPSAWGGRGCTDDRAVEIRASR